MLRDVNKKEWWKIGSHWKKDGRIISKSETGVPETGMSREIDFVSKEPKTLMTQEELDMTMKESLREGLVGVFVEEEGGGYNKKVL